MTIVRMPSESVPINNASWSRNSRHWHQFLSLRPPGLNLRLFSLTIKTIYIYGKGEVKAKATHMRYYITVRESIPGSLEYKRVLVAV